MPLPNRWWIAAAVCAGLTACRPSPLSIDRHAGAHKVLAVLADSEDYFDSPRRQHLMQVLSQNGVALEDLEFRSFVVAADALPGDSDLQAALHPRNRYDVAFATTMTIARSAQILRPTLPIVFEGAANPVQLCLVDSLLRPGRNATGYTRDVAVEAKMIETLLDAYPRLEHLIVPVDDSPDVDRHCVPIRPSDDTPCAAGSIDSPHQLQPLMAVAEMQSLAARRGVTLNFVRVCREEDLASLNRWIRPNSGFIVPMHFLMSEHVATMTRGVALLRVPAIYADRRAVDVDGLMSLSPVGEKEPDTWAYTLLAQILEGRAPATLPVEMPTAFELRLNAKAAMAAGLQPSLQALRRADEVLR